MNAICAFSSDSRELYKADIYRVLAFPENHIVHFRYKTKYVDGKYIDKPNKLKKKTVAIFFTHGNEIGSKKNQSQHISVRWAVVTNAEYSLDTDVFHVYMKLGKFCNLNINIENSLSKLPPNKFFTNLSYSQLDKGNNWQSRILEIKNFFPKLTFFHLKDIMSGCRSVPVRYSNSGKSCFYNLKHGNRYLIKLAVSNPDDSDTKIEISDSSNEITINCINPFESSIQFDDHDIPISVKTLQVSKQASLIEFKPTKKNMCSGAYEAMGEYSTNIELDLTLGFKRPFYFGLFSTIAFWALILVRPEGNWPSCIISIVATIMFFFSSGLLFYWFNKK